MEQCILLNADGNYLSLISWKRAMCLISKNAVKVLKYTEKIVRTVTKEYKIPSIIMLVKMIRIKWKGSVPYSKKNVIIRDRYICQYCGCVETLKNKMTIDHIIPKSKGGKSTFENTVSCCKICNNRKGDRTPSESKMYLKKMPKHPTIGEFLHKRIKNINEILKKELV